MNLSIDIDDAVDLNSRIKFHLVKSKPEFNSFFLCEKSTFRLQGKVFLTVATFKVTENVPDIYKRAETRIKGYLQLFPVINFQPSVTRYRTNHGTASKRHHRSDPTQHNVKNIDLFTHCCFVVTMCPRFRHRSVVLL